MPAQQPVLLREDSGFDSARLLLAKAVERERYRSLGRSFDFICKWNPRKQDKAAWIARLKRPRPLSKCALARVLRYCR